MTPAAAYLRSSKDRNDVSLSAQLLELNNLAVQRGLTIQQTYEDAVQSGSTDDRPAFRELIADIKNANRGWSHLLVFDTSRIARGRYIAQAFRHECRRRGVELIIAKMPETDPISNVILESVLEAMDEVHSIMSREKGLAGMRENVRRGWRAGGRAPYGYQLQHEATGTIRDGKPVMKSKLIAVAGMDHLAKFLKLRASGIPRVEARKRCSIDLPPATLVDMEWNALVYAGHTVWNRHNAKKARGSGKAKRRDRSEWVIQRDTHPAMISDAQAESIIAQLETSMIGQAVSAAKASGSDYLLSGLLQTEDGQLWVGAGIHYRLKPRDGRSGKRIKRDELERGVLVKLREDLRSESLINAITAKSKQLVQLNDPAEPVRNEIEKLKKKKDRAAMLALQQNDEVYVRLVEDMSRQIESLEREANALDAERRAGNAMAEITPSIVREMLLSLDSDRALVTSMIQRIVLTRELTGRIEYGLEMASPRSADRWAAPAMIREFKLTGT
jgi:DNA invertase Pin-like site-specific DNA recombinase